jgi:hypothetical protein
VEVFGNEWLGRRDSNPDTQIQSSLDVLAAQSNEQVSSANCGEVEQNPQHSRNAEARSEDAAKETTLMHPAHSSAEFDFEEDTLP